MRTLSKSLIGLFVVAFFLTVASSARADDFNWSFTAGTLQTSGSGTLTTGTFSGGQATITGITGTFGGGTISGLNGGPYYLYDTSPYLDGTGFAFSTVGLVDSISIYWDSVYSVYAFFSVADDFSAGGTFTLTPIGAPEPGTILLLGSGLLMLFGLARLRRQAEPV